MIIGVPKEIKISENRVGMTEAGVKQLVHEGHQVFVQKDAGLGSRITNENYLSAGAKILDTAKEIYGKAEMIVKVKEPLADEYELLKENLILYTYLHLAAEPKLTKVLCDRKVKAIAYETIQIEDGSLPLLTPMSEVAGRMAIFKKTTAEKVSFSAESLVSNAVKSLSSVVESSASTLPKWQ